MSTSIFKMAKGLFGNEAEAGAVAKPGARPTSRPGSATVTPVKKAVNPWHAVSIAPGLRACAAARAYGDKRFLSREAPILPLKNCDCAKCECHYEHHEDRRKGPRRAREMGVAIDGFTGHDMREKVKRGRRKTDK